MCPEIVRPVPLAVFRGERVLVKDVRSVHQFLRDVEDVGICLSVLLATLLCIFRVELLTQLVSQLVALGRDVGVA